MTSFTDGQLARDLAIREGIPAGDIYLLNTTSTWEDGQQIAAGVKERGLRRIVIVTNWYHSRRALAALGLWAWTCQRERAMRPLT